MSDQTPRIPKRLHCRELDGERTGILILSDERIELYFVGYDEFAYVPVDGAVCVVTEEGTVASLHANVPGRLSTQYVKSKFGGKDRNEDDEHRKVCQSGIISNLAVIGADAWRPDDLVRRLSFEVDQTKHVLSHRKKVQSLGRTSHPSDDKLVLYRVAAKDMTFVAGYAATYSSDMQSVTAYRPSFLIEFTVGITLNAIERPLFHYLSFLSFVLGGRMVPAAVRVNRLSSGEMIDAVKKGIYVGDHEVMQNWPVDENEAKELAFHGAPFAAEDDTELAALGNGLSLWIKRSDKWERAYIRMTDCLRVRRVISGERLIAAWRWFEELPNAGAERMLDDTVIEPMIQAAMDAARDKDLAISEDRIRGSLRRVGEETMRDRFTRLVNSVRAQFGGDKNLEGMINHLINARDFRGRVAHGHFAPQDESEMRRFHKATLAVEALCFLLTAHDLPLTEAGKSRVWSHPVLQDYWLAYS